MLQKNLLFCNEAAFLIKNEDKRVRKSFSQWKEKIFNCLLFYTHRD